MRFFKKIKTLAKRLAASTISLYLLQWLMHVLLCTLRVEIRGKELLKQPRPFIIALWHNQIAIVPLIRQLIHTPFRIIISNSRDGQILTRFAMLYPQVTVTSVRQKTRHQALAEMIEVLSSSEEIVLITPDGPRGPVHQVKPGVIYSAQKTGAKIIGMSWQADRFWEFSSWDKMRLPKPFSKVVLSLEGPLECSEETPTDLLQTELATLLSK